MASVSRRVRLDILLQRMPYNEWLLQALFYHGFGVQHHALEQDEDEDDDIPDLIPVQGEVVS